MNLQNKNVYFFYAGIVLIILSQIIFKISSGGSILSTLGQLFSIIAIIIYGFLNYTKLKLWLKIIITLITTPIASYLLFLLIWGITTGFKFSF